MARTRAFLLAIRLRRLLLRLRLRLLLRLRERDLFTDEDTLLFVLLLARADRLLLLVDLDLDLGLRLQPTRRDPLDSERSRALDFLRFLPEGDRLLTRAAFAEDPAELLSRCCFFLVFLPLSCLVFAFAFCLAGDGDDAATLSGFFCFFFFLDPDRFAFCTFFLGLAARASFAFDADLDLLPAFFGAGRASEDAAEADRFSLLLPPDEIPLEMEHSLSRAMLATERLPARSPSLRCVSRSAPGWPVPTQ